MAKCEVCDKSVKFGRNIRHKASGGWARRAPKTNRTFKPNIQKTTLTFEGGVQVQLKLCTKCLRSMYKTR
ncbi:MAG TPA: bL28 family ribosomal protein [Roseiflexaceae bacterium]|nr:bL28 family ribosomal protein [Roseiflexaceae bacterium]HMP41946.1 bL28 family ribosomal protein [Roseiflexaceae bacterium]